MTARGATRSAPLRGRSRVSVPVRVLLAVSHGMTALFRLFEAVRDEMLLAFVPLDQRDAITAASYARAVEYLPAGQIFEQGLFSWEKALLARPGMPTHGRVLLPGAGGGRELKAFVERGYEVFAFEPAARLCAACREIVGDRGGPVAQAAYADLLRLARDGSGPLSGFDGPFDLVWLGWGSFTHVTVAEDHAAILASIRSLAPVAPLVLSFYLHPPVPPPQGRLMRLRRTLRRALRDLGGAGESWSVEYWANVGFTYTFSEAELRALFHAAGYSIAVFEADPYPHALLLPSSS